MGDEHIVKVSTGVEFRVVGPAAFALRDIQRGLEEHRPVPPVVYIEAKSREEDNPNDPTYLDNLERYEQDLAAKLFEASVVLGLETVSAPEGLPSLEDESWVEDHKIAGITIPENGRGRFLAWVKYVAAPLPADMAAIESAIASYLGVPEGEVAAAVESFQNRKERRADRKSPSKRRA